MNEDTFWKIIEDAGSPDQCEPAEQCERIQEALTRRPMEDLIAFENIREQLIQKSYTWPMIKACFITLSYVSDDVFESFQHWVILNGRGRFNETIANPDSIASYAQVQDPVEEISGECLMFVCEEVWEGDIEEIEEQVTVTDRPDLEDEWPPKEKLQSEFPALFARFWNEDRMREIHGES